MKPDVIANLQDVIRTQVETDKSKLNELLQENKISIMLIKGPEVLMKIIKIVKRAAIKRTHKLSDIDVKRIHDIKKKLKGDTDIMYLITLLIQLRETVSHLNISQLSEDVVSIIREEAVANITDLSKLNNLLTKQEKK